MQEQSLNKRYIVKLLSNVFGVIVNLCITVVVPNILGPNAYGNFSYLQNLFNQIIAFVDFSVSSAFFTKLSADNSRKILISFYVIFMIFLFFLVYGFVYFVDILDLDYLLIPNIPSQYLYYGFFLGVLGWIYQTVIRISDAFAVTVGVEIIKIIHRGILLLLLFCFMYIFNFSLYTYFYYYFISYISFFVIILLYFYKNNIFKFFLKISISEILKIIKEFYGFCHPLITYNLINIVIGFFDVWLLQKVSGSVQSGFYALTYSLAAVAFIFTSSMTPIIIREFAKFYEIKNIVELRNIFLKYVPSLFSLVAFISIFIAFNSGSILKIFISNKFWNADLAMSIIAFYPIHQTYGQISGGFFHATGRVRQFRNISLCMALPNIVVSLITILFLNFGAAGLAIKMVVIQLILVNIQLWFNIRFLSLNIVYFFKHQILVVVCFSVIAYLASLPLIFDNIVLNFIVSWLLYCLFGIMLVFLCPWIFAINKNSILYKIRKG